MTSQMDRFQEMRIFTRIGLLRVNLQPALSKHMLAPALPAFLARYPGIDLQIGEGDRLVDLVGEGIDCVLRAGRLVDSSMVAQQVAQLAQVTCASPAYLARHGRPASLDDLDRHHAVHFISSCTGRPYPLEFSIGGGVRPLVLPASVLYPQSRQLSPRVRVFVDWIEEVFAQSARL